MAEGLDLAPEKKGARSERVPWKEVKRDEKMVIHKKGAGKCFASHRCEMSHWASPPGPSLLLACPTTGQQL